MGAERCREKRLQLPHHSALIVLPFLVLAVAAGNGGASLPEFPSCSLPSAERVREGGEWQLEVRLTVLRRTARSLTTGYEIRRGDTVLATGEMKTAYCLIPAGGQLKSTEMPPEYADRLGEGQS